MHIYIASVLRGRKGLKHYIRCAVRMIKVRERNSGNSTVQRSIIIIV